MGGEKKQKKKKKLKIFKLFLTNNNFNFESHVILPCACNSYGNSQNNYSFQDSPFHIISLYTKRPKWKKKESKPNKKAYIVYPVFNERMKLTDYPAPTGAFFYAILMIINWQWLMAGTELIEDTTAPFYPIHFSIFLSPCLFLNNIKWIICPIWISHFKVHRKHICPIVLSPCWLGFHILECHSVSSLRKATTFKLEIQENTHVLFHMFCR